MLSICTRQGRWYTARQMEFLLLFSLTRFLFHLFAPHNHWLEAHLNSQYSELEILGIEIESLAVRGRLNILSRFPGSPDWDLHPDSSEKLRWTFIEIGIQSKEESNLIWTFIESGIESNLLVNVPLTPVKVGCVWLCNCNDYDNSNKSSLFHMISLFWNRTNQSRRPSSCYF